MQLTQLIIKPATLAIATLVVSLGTGLLLAAQFPFSSNIANSNSQLTASSCSLPDETPPKTTQTDENA